ncbi:hypothetical protein LJB76_00520, partial [Clostridia bacterium OttesenSCG-928-O13]|nr:hypothetical protein [Clostridia bacterium OttesenSCG-928-O13]
QKATLKAQTEQSARQLAEDGEALMHAYEDARGLRRAADKAVANNALTQAENNWVEDLLSGRRQLSEQMPADMNARGVREVYEAKKAVQDVMAPVEMLNRDRRQARIAQAESMLEGAAGWKDKKAGFFYSRETPERNIRDVVGSNEGAKKLTDAYITPIHHHEAQATRWKNEILGIVKKLNLNPVERGYVQAKGELEGLLKRQAAGLQVNPAELEHLTDVVKQMADKYGAKIDTAKVEKALPVFQDIYDTVLKLENEAYVRNGYAPTASIGEGYFPHFERKETMFERMGRWMRKDSPGDDLPTDIAGKTQNFKPNRKYNPYIQHRKGFRTEYDAIKGLEARLNVAGDVIYHTDDIQNLRALEDAVRGKFGSKGAAEAIANIRADQSLSPKQQAEQLEKVMGENHLAGFARWLNEYTNILAGKKSFADRSVEQEMGRAVYEIVNGLESRVASNMIGANLGSAMSNNIPVQQAMAEVGPANMLEGLLDTVKNYIKNDGLVDEIDFLANRRGTMRVGRSAGEKASDFLSGAMELMDDLTTNWVTRGKVISNLKSGMSRSEALQSAGEWAQGLMAGRSKGSMPTLFARKSPLGRVLTMFQLEVNNQLSYLLKDIPRNAKNKAELAKKVGLFLVSAHIYGDIYEKVVGRKAVLDPIGIANEAIGDFTGYQLPNIVDAAGGIFSGEGVDFTTEKQSPGKALMNLGVNVAENLPFIGGLLGGGRVPVQGAIPDIANVASTTADWMGGEMPGNKAAQEIWGELSKPLYYLLPPTGGGQIKKAVDTTKLLMDGGRYTYDGDGNRRLQYALGDVTPGQYVKAYMFGPYSLPDAKEWVEGGFGSKSVRETAAFDAAREAGVSKDVFEEWWDTYKAIEPEKGVNGNTVPGSSRQQALNAVHKLGVSDAQALTLLAGANDDMAEEIEMLRGYGVQSDFAIKELLGAKSVSEGVRNTILGSVGLQGEALLNTYKMYSTSAQGEKMQAAYDNNVAPETYLQYRTQVDQYRMQAGEAENFRLSRNQSAEAMLGLGLDEDQLYGLYTAENAADNKVVQARYMGIGTSDYLSYNIVQESFAKERGKTSLNVTESAMLTLALAERGGMSQQQAMALYSLNNSESQAQKIQKATEWGVEPQTYLTYITRADYNGNGSVTQEEAIAALNSLDISREQKAQLFYLQNSSWKARPFGYW